jgi:polyphosphate kinase 2
MAKHKKSKKKNAPDTPEVPVAAPDTSEGSAAAPDTADGPPPKLKNKEYEREMRLLQGELVAMQEWVKATGARVCVVFEGVDSAGKGGTIQRIMERTSPRVFKHIALPTPDARVQSQMYIQRYIAHFPAAGEVVIFDRSWYNRAGVEPVMGYCTPAQTERFLKMTPQVEKAMVDDGIILIKYFLNVSRPEQTRRLHNRIDDPRKIWKLSPTDLKSYSRRYAYLHARDEMILATSTEWAPWHIVDNDDKKRGRLNIISHLLSQIPYEAPPRPETKMPRPPSPRGYVEPDSSQPNIPTPF